MSQSKNEKLIPFFKWVKKDVITHYKRLFGKNPPSHWTKKEIEDAITNHEKSNNLKAN